MVSPLVSSVHQLKMYLAGTDSSSAERGFSAGAGDTRLAVLKDTGPSFRNGPENVHRYETPNPKKHTLGAVSCPAADPIAPSATTLSTSEEEEKRKVPTTTDTSSRVGIRGIKVRHKKFEHIR